MSLDIPAPGSGCAAPAPSDSLAYSDDQIVFWMDLDRKAGEPLSVKLTTASRKLDRTITINPVTSNGGYCYYFYFPLKNNPPAAVEGAWKFEVFSGAISLGKVNTYITGPDVPSIQPGGIVNSASLSSNSGILAPGTLVTILGNKLARNTQRATATPLPTSLGGVSVLVNGVAAGIYAISPAEIGIQFPWGMPTDSALIQVNNNGVLTNVERVLVGSSSPGVFLDPKSSGSVALAYRYSTAGSSLGKVSPTNPLQRGDMAVFYVTGAGAVSNPPRNYAHGNKNSKPVNPVSVMFGGADSKSVSATLSSRTDPGSVGVTYVVAKVPDELPTGPAVPVTIVVGSAAAVGVTVPVGGSAPAFGALRISSISGFPAVSTSGTYNPGSAINISGSGFHTNVKTYVRFEDGKGYKATIPASSVYSDRVISSVPPYVDTNAHHVVAGTVTCKILQAAGNKILTSNSATIQIAQLFRAQGTTGHVTASYLATLSQSARLLDQAYSYKQAITSGKKFRAASTHQAVDEIVTGLRPLVGGVKEVELGAASSVDLGLVNGNPLTLDSNTIALLDALISAALIENRKALVKPPIVLGQSTAPSGEPAGGTAPHSIIGSLLGIAGKTISCNSPLNKLADEVSGEQSNCPSPQEVWNQVAQAGRDSFREAIDSTVEDAKRFATTVGAGIAILAGGEGAAVVGEIVDASTTAHALGHLALWVTANDDNGLADKQAVLHDVADYIKGKLEEGAKDLNSDVDKSLEDVIAGTDAQTRADYEAIEQGYGIGEKLSKLTLPDAIAKLVATSDDMPENVTTERDETQADGSTLLDQSVDTAPAEEFTGRVEDSGGAPLEDAGVEFTTGDDSVPPIVAGPTLMDGSYDLLVPKGSVGSAVPDSGQLEVQLLDEHGGVLSVTGDSVDLAGGTQDLGSVTVAYDSDDDGDDDSDGSNIRKRSRASLIHTGHMAHPSLWGELNGGVTLSASRAARSINREIRKKTQPRDTAILREFEAPDYPL